MTPRYLAHDILLKWFTSEQYLDHLLHSGESGLSPQDRRFAGALIHQVILNRRMLEHVLDKYVSKKPKKPVWVLLLMGACEILYMQVPDHAALHETVGLTGRIDARSRGFVNAVLRKVLRFRDTEWEGLQKDPRIAPGIRYGFPDWLITRWTGQFGSGTGELLSALNERPRKMARIVDTPNREKILAELAELGVLEEVSTCHPDYVFIRSWQSLLEHPLFLNGALTAQDVSAVFPALLIAKDEPGSVADVCCAPGGKLSALRQYCPPTVLVHGYDRSEKRLEETRKNLARLNMPDIPLRKADAGTDVFPRYSHILADVPCSGFGVIRKRPDLRWRRKAEDMRTLPEIQREILENICRYLETGGMIVYSTCTFDREENFGTVCGFLKRHPEFSIVPPDPDIFPADMITPEGALASYPHRHKCEGSFAISLRKH